MAATVASAVHEGPYAAGVADEREAAPADVLGDRAGPGERGPGAVERSVAQNHALEAFGADNCGFEVTDGIENRGEAGGRAGIERIVLSLHRAALARVGPSGEALGDEPEGAGDPGGGDEVVGALGAQPVGESEVAVDAPDVQASRDRVWESGSSKSALRSAAQCWCTSPVSTTGLATRRSAMPPRMRSREAT
ncbi:hypothetical protein BH20ACT18_BH20ACT18_03420 [soil metagenome]